MLKTDYAGLLLKNNRHPLILETVDTTPLSSAWISSTSCSCAEYEGEFSIIFADIRLETTWSCFFKTVTSAVRASGKEFVSTNF